MTEGSMREGLHGGHQDRWVPPSLGEGRSSGIINVWEPTWHWVHRSEHVEFISGRILLRSYYGGPTDSFKAATKAIIATVKAMGSGRGSKAVPAIIGSSSRGHKSSTSSGKTLAQMADEAPDLSMKASTDTLSAERKLVKEISTRGSSDALAALSEAGYKPLQDVVVDKSLDRVSQPPLAVGQGPALSEVGEGAFGRSHSRKSLAIKALDKAAANEEAEARKAAAKIGGYEVPKVPPRPPAAGDGEASKGSRRVSTAGVVLEDPSVSTAAFNDDVSEYEDKDRCSGGFKSTPPIPLDQVWIAPSSSLPSHVLFIIARLISDFRLDPIIRLDLSLSLRLRKSSRRFPRRRPRNMSRTSNHLLSTRSVLVCNRRSALSQLKSSLPRRVLLGD